jgi:hypothetical protein
LKPRVPIIPHCADSSFLIGRIFIQFNCKTATFSYVVTSGYKSHLGNVSELWMLICKVLKLDKNMVELKGVEPSTS